MGPMAAGNDCRLRLPPLSVCHSWSI